MRLLLIFLLFLSVTFSGKSQQLNIFMTTTPVSVYGGCDGTMTLWVEGAAALDSFMFLLYLPPSTTAIDTIIANDTIVTIGGICAGTYLATLDTLWGSCPSYGNGFGTGCCNCIGSTSCGGTAGAGATATVGGPGPALDFTFSGSCPHPCGFSLGYCSVQIIGQAPPYMVNFGPAHGGWTSGTGIDLICSNFLSVFPNTIQVKDATGQVVTKTNTVYCPGCGKAAILGSIPTIELCAGQTFGPINFNSYLLTGNPYYSSQGMYSWTNNNTATGVAASSPPVSSSSQNNMFSFTAANVSTSQTSTITLVSHVGQLYPHAHICEGNTITFNVIVRPLPAVNAGPDVSVCNTNQVTLSASGATNITWSNGVINDVPFTPPLGTTTYTASASNTFGCSGSDQVSVIVKPLPAINGGVNQTVCSGNPIILSGSGGISYAWDNGVANNVAFIPPVGTTTYQVTGIGSNGCQNVDQVQVVVNPLPAINAGADVNVCAGNSVTLSGSGGTSYIWNNGVANNVTFIPTVGTATYQVTGTGSNGCQNVDQVQVIVNALPTIDAGSNQQVCAGDQITLSGSGGMSYGWNNGVADNVAFIPTLGTTTYQVTGTDVNGCQNTDQVDITVHPLPTVDAGTDQTVCDGYQVTLSGSGATTYTWDNGISNNVSFTPSATATYVLTGTDVNGCQNTDQADITVNPLPTVDAGTDQTVCDGDQASLSGSGATTYTWDNGISNNVSFTPSTTATYVLTGIDANGCENTDQVDVIVNPLPTIDAGTNQTVCEGDLVTLSGSGGSSYVWDNGVINGVAFVVSSGTTTYEVTGTDINGCESTDQVDVAVNALPTIDAGVDQSICFGETVALSGSGGASYTWNNGVSNNVPFAQGIGTITYEVIGIDAAGCENTDQIDVTVNDIPTIDGGSDTTVCFGESVLLSAIGNGTIDWTGGLANNSYFAPTVSFSEMICTATTVAGCQNTDTILVSMINQINTNLMLNGADVVAVSGYSNYEWQYCEFNLTIQNGSQNIFTATQDDGYKVIIRNSENCYDTSACVFIDYLDLSTISENGLIYLTPNPTTGIVFISNGDQIERISIYDAAGRIVEQVVGETSTLDFSRFENGQYFVRMTTIDKRSVIARVIKQDE